MNSQNQNQDKSNQQTPAQSKDQNQTTQQQPIGQEDQKDVKGGSGIASGGNDLSNMLEGGLNLSNSSSGSDGQHSYTSQDSHNLDLGLGNMLDNTNF